MSAITPSVSLALRSTPSTFRPKFQNPAKTHHLSPFTTSVSTRKILVFHNQAPRVLIHLRKSQFRRVSATPEEIAQEIVSSSSATVAGDGGGDDGVYVIIQVLLFVAFVALAILTIGVVYIGVSDFLEKREIEKFEKEAASKKSKKGGKKKVSRARAGPRGFGQKMDDDDLDDLS